MLLTQLSRDKWALVRVQKEGKVILPRFGSSNLFFEPFVFEHILFSNIFCLRTYFVRPIFVDRACKAPHKPPSGVRESCLCEWLSKFYFASVFYIFLFFEVHYTLPYNEHSFLHLFWLPYLPVGKKKAKVNTLPVKNIQNKKNIAHKWNCVMCLNSFFIFISKNKLFVFLSCILLNWIFVNNESKWVRMLTYSCQTQCFSLAF